MKFIKPSALLLYAKRQNVKSVFLINLARNVYHPVIKPLHSSACKCLLFVHLHSPDEVHKTNALTEWGKWAMPIGSLGIQDKDHISDLV